MRTPFFRILTIAGWILLALEVAFVALLFVQRNMGDDAAGRGMATGFAIVLTPAVLVAGGLLFWGTRSGGPRAALWAGLFFVSTPVLFFVYSFVDGTVHSIDQAMGRAEFGTFDGQPALTKMARAIDREDVAELKQLIAAGPIDFAARDRRGRTILGHAVTHVLQIYDGGPQSAGSRGVEQVKLLLAAGAKPIENAIAPERTSAEPEGHLLLATVIGVTTPGALELLDVLLSAGLSPDGVDMDDRPVIFSTYLTKPKLDVLLRHGVNLQARDVRSDRRGWSVLMNAAYMSQWDVAPVFLERGVPPDYQAPDGQTLQSILDEKKAEYGHGPVDPGYVALVDALETVRGRE